MSEPVVIVDTAAIINLFAGKGADGWSQLFRTNKRVVVLEIMLEELVGAVDDAIDRGASLPSDLADQFDNWLEANASRGAVKVSYNAPDFGSVINSVYQAWPMRVSDIVTR